MGAIYDAGRIGDANVGDVDGDPYLTYEPFRDSYTTLSGPVGPIYDYRRVSPYIYEG